MVSCADLLLTLDWSSETRAGTVRHRDHLFAEAVDLAHDALPGSLKAALADAGPGEDVSVAVTAADLIGRTEGVVAEVAQESFRGRRANGVRLQPKFGRFYPAIYFEGLSSGQAGGVPAVRCVGANGTKIRLDTGHPLSDRPLALSARVVGRVDGDTAGERMPVHWGAQLALGPGMQACWQGAPTEFLDDESFARPDEGSDVLFYAAPRLAAHIDSRAQRTVGAFYREVLPSGGLVLDLMSSLHSNLADDHAPERLVGLGLNGPEMDANPRLGNAVVADLNTGHGVPFAGGTFDGAVCTVSIDYLTDPVSVIAEVGRVLRPGAPFAVSFSNRWFPPKVTRLWTELHPFEQVGLVVQYFERTGRFTDIETATFRGYPRPMDDPYYHEVSESDPVFAVAGRAKG